MDDDRGTNLRLVKVRNLRLSQVSRVLVTSEQHLDAAGRRWVEDRAVAVVQDFSLVAVLDVERPEPPASAAALLAAAKERGCGWLTLRSDADSTSHDLIEGLPVYEED